MPKIDSPIYNEWVAGGKKEETLEASKITLLNC